MEETRFAETTEEEREEMEEKNNSIWELDHSLSVFGGLLTVEILGEWALASGHLLRKRPATVSVWFWKIMA